MENFCDANPPNISSNSNLKPKSSEYPSSSIFAWDMYWPSTLTSLDSISDLMISTSAIKVSLVEWCGEVPSWKRNHFSSRFFTKTMPPQRRKPQHYQKSQGSGSYPHPLKISSRFLRLDPFACQSAQISSLTFLDPSARFWKIRFARDRIAAGES